MEIEGICVCIFRFLVLLLNGKQFFGLGSIRLPQQTGKPEFLCIFPLFPDSFHPTDAFIRRFRWNGRQLFLCAKDQLHSGVFCLAVFFLPFDLCDLLRCQADTVKDRPFFLWDIFGHQLGVFFFQRAAGIPRQNVEETGFPAQQGIALRGRNTVQCALLVFVVIKVGRRVSFAPLEVGVKAEERIFGQLSRRGLAVLRSLDIHCIVCFCCVDLAANGGGVQTNVFLEFQKFRIVRTCSNVIQSNALVAEQSNAVVHAGGEHLVIGGKKAGTRCFLIAQADSGHIAVFDIHLDQRKLRRPVRRKVKFF